jgi:hypothetical protein
MFFVVHICVVLICMVGSSSFPLNPLYQLATAVGLFTKPISIRWWIL